MYAAMNDDAFLEETEPYVAIVLLSVRCPVRMPTKVLYAMSPINTTRDTTDMNDAVKMMYSNEVYRSYSKDLFTPPRAATLDFCTFQQSDPTSITSVIDWLHIPANMIVVRGVRRLTPTTTLYHMELRTLRTVAMLRAHHKNLLWVTWKELCATHDFHVSMQDQEHQQRLRSPRRWNMGLPSPPFIHQWTIHPVALGMIYDYLCSHDHAPTTTYHILYHGTDAQNRSSIIGRGLYKSRGHQHMMGPALYLAAYSKALRFAMFEPSIRKTPRSKGVIFRVMVDVRGASQTSIRIEHPETHSECVCEKCVEQARRDTYQKHRIFRQLVDHTGTWMKTHDFLVIPPHKMLSRTYEYAVKNPDRVILLSDTFVSAIRDMGRPLTERDSDSFVAVMDPTSCGTHDFSKYV